jgi:glycosyltransferase involved in cell wall biosynthesis
MDRKIKIVFFIGGLVSGGKERRLIELLSFLKKNSDYETIVLTTKSTVHYKEFSELGVYHQQIGKSRFLKVFFILKDLYFFFKAQKPEIVHTWGRVQTMYTLPLKLAFGFKLINSQITNAPSRFSFSDKKIDRINFKFSDVIISNSQAGVAAYQPDQKKTVVIPNGMRMERFERLPAKDVVKKKYGVSTPFLVIMVATLSTKKNYPLFFRVAKEVIKSRSDVTFLSAGWFDADAPYYKENLRIIDNEDRIILVGEIQDVEALVNAADIGVLFSTSSYGEGLSNSILEYMALSKPTIATSFGGSKELVRNAETGFLVEPENIEDIVPIFCNLLDQPELMVEMGVKARKDVEENYTIERMGQRYKAIYMGLNHNKKDSLS